MKKKCNCGCHTNRSILHVVACCDANQEIQVGPVLYSGFIIPDYEIKNSNIPIDDRIENHKQLNGELIAREIISVLPWEELRLEKSTEYRTSIAIYSYDEMRNILVKLKRLKETVSSTNHYDDSITEINDIMRLLNP